MLYILAGIALLGILALGGVLLLISQRDEGGEASGLAATMRSGGCAYRKAASEGARHVPDGTPIQWKTFPPTSGNHYATPAVWNLYEEPVEQARVVHNLEHGGVAIQYGSEVPQETASAVRDFYLDDPNGILLAPLPRLRDKIALTAWTQIATCDGFDESAFKAFIDAFRAKGPERIPLSEMGPGHP
jgi:hypothetical protein